MRSEQLSYYLSSMKRPIRFLIIFIGILIGILFIARITNAFQFYIFPTTANEPTIKLNSYFFGSNLKKPERNSFICFKTTYDGEKEHFATFRICGIEGDIIQIRNGTLFVNNKNADSTLNLMHDYSIRMSELPENFPDNYMEEARPNDKGDSFYISLSDKTIMDYKINAVRINLPRDYPDPVIAKAYSAPWNLDHFGPVTVPMNHFFVLGDNRHWAADSRYQGFIPKEKFVTTILWK